MAADHFVSASCGGEVCSICRDPATHKVGEEIFADDPLPIRHNLTAYVCCDHFGDIMGVECSKVAAGGAGGPDPARPGYLGRAGVAIQILLGDLADPAQEATLAAWLIHAPGQSPAWSDYQVSVIHLRDIPGVPNARIGRAGATHEMVICALDPTYRPNARDHESRVPLLPMNAEIQFTGTDEQAISLAELAARAICNGALPAEAPTRGQGQQIWRAAIDTSLEHMNTPQEGGQPSHDQGQ